MYFIVKRIENGREIRTPCLLYIDDLVLCYESKESLRGSIEGFSRVCIRRGLKVKVNKSKVLVNKGSPQSEIMLDSEQSEHISEFNMLNEKGTDDTVCSRKVVCGWKVDCAI